MRTPTPSHPSGDRRGAPGPGVRAAALFAPRRAPQEVERQLARYLRGHRVSLQVFAAEHQAFEDLLFSCPALAVSLAARRGPPADRGEALNLIRRGAPLIEALAAVELPLWLRKLPPEAFAHAPPYPFPQPRPERAKRDQAYDPRADAAFGRRAVNLQPRSEWTGWMRWLMAARQAGGDDFALWLMSHRLNWSRCGPERGLGPLAAFAWCSSTPEAPAYDHLPREWTSTADAPQRGALRAQLDSAPLLRNLRSRPGFALGPQSQSSRLRLRGAARDRRFRRGGAFDEKLPRKLRGGRLGGALPRLRDEARRPKRRQS